MADITELAQREKFEAWLSEKPLHARYVHWCGSLKAYDYASIQLAWQAYQAGGAELVEALEKAQTINAAAEKLVRCKGRYHSEQNYRALAALFGVNTPDLPPLDDESHAVTVENLQESAYRAGLTAGWNLGLANNNDGFNKCLAAHAAGIKVEAE